MKKLKQKMINIKKELGLTQKNNHPQQQPQEHPEESLRPEYKDVIIDLQPTFKEHYALYTPYSRAAIVEDVEGEFKYLLLEPTLTQEDTEWIQHLKGILWDELTINAKDLGDKVAREEFLKTQINNTVAKYKIEVDLNTLDKYQYYIIRDFLNFGQIDGFMRDEYIEDISCDGVNNPIYVWHRKYESIPTNVIYTSQEDLDSFILKVAYLCGRHISIAQPLLDGSLPDGSRAQVTYGTEVTPKGSTFTIRKFKASPLTITDLINFKTLSTKMAAYFWFLIENRHSVMIGGDIGGGKTTMLNTFSLFVRPNLKIVSIEDTQEIQLPHENWQMMVTRQGLQTGAGAIGERGQGAISMFDLLRAALRQRPDYIIVGEIRGEEAYALFQAMSTGHLGLTTIHAQHVQGILHRLTTKPMNIPHTLVENLDTTAIVRKMVLDNVSLRRTTEVSEIIGWDRTRDDFKTHPVFRWDPSKDVYKYTGKSLILEGIARQWGYSLQEIELELEKREVILDYLVRKKIRTYQEVTGIIMDYFADPEAVYRKARVS